MFSGRFSSAAMRCCAMFIILLFVTAAGRAQSPVTVSVQLTGPFSGRLSDLYLGATPKLRVMLVNNDFTRPGLRVRLNMQIKGMGSRTGLTLSSAPAGIYPTVFLDPGTPVTLSLNNLGPYFKTDNMNFMGYSREEYLRAGILPAGSYEFCFSVSEVGSNRIVSASSCQTVVFSEAMPPLLQLPLNNATQTLTEPLNMSFSWTERHIPSSAFPAEYTLQLIEMWDTMMNVQAAFESRPPLVEKVTKSTSLVYGPADPMLMPNKKYAWRVHVHEPASSTGAGNVFSNNGYSQVFTFRTSMGGRCVAASKLSSQTQGDLKLVKWTNGNANVMNRTVLEYSLKPPPDAAITWKSSAEMAATVTSAYLPDTGSAGKVYYVRIAQVCNTDSKKYYSDTMTVIYPGSGLVTGRIMEGVFAKTLEDESSYRPLANASAPSDSSYKLYSPVRSNGKPLANVKVKMVYGQVPVVVKKNGAHIVRDTFEVWRKLSGVSYALESPYKPTHYEKMWSKGGNQANFNEYRKAGTAVQYTGFWYMKYEFKVNETTRTGDYEEIIYPDSTVTTTDKNGFFSFSVNSPDTLRKVIVSFENPGDNGNKKTLRGNFVNTVNGLDFGEIPALKRVFQLLPIAKDNKYNTQPVTANLYKDGRLLKTITSGNPLYLPAEDVKYTLKIVSGGIEDASSVQFNINKAITGDSIQVIRKSTLQVPSNVDIKIKLYSSIPGRAERYRSYLKNNNGFFNVGKTHDDGIFRVSQMKPNDSGDIDINGRSPYVAWINDTREDEPITVSVNNQYSLTFPMKHGKYTKLIDMDDMYVHSIVGRVYDQYGYPVAGAKIGIDDGRGFFRVEVYSDKDGFWASTLTTGVGISYKEYRIRTSINGYKELIETYKYPEVNKTGRVEMNEDLWLKKVESLPEVSKHLKANNLPTISLAIFDNRFTHLPDVYKFIHGEYLMGQVIDGGRQTVYVKKGKLSVIPSFSQEYLSLGSSVKNVPLKITISNSSNAILFTKVITVGGRFDTSMVPGSYSFKVESNTPDVTFAASQGDFTINFDETTEVKPRMASLIRVTGMVKDSANATIKMAGAKVSVLGLPYTAVTDANGYYSIGVPQNEAIEFRVSRDDYDSRDFSYIITKTGSVDFPLTKRDPSMPKISTFAGYNAKVDKIVKSSKAGEFSISGELTVPGNEVFDPGENGKLTFSNAIVKVASGSSNAVPLSDIIFEETELASKAFGYAPVQLSAEKGLRLKAMKVNGVYSYEKGIIGGDEIVVKLSGNKQVAGLPMRLMDAVMINPDSAVYKADSIRGKPFALAYTPPNTAINALKRKELTYVIQFIDAHISKSIKFRDSVAKKNATQNNSTVKVDSAQARANAIAAANDSLRYMKVAISGGVMNFLIEREMATMDEKGINLNGYVRLPKAASTKFSDSGMVEIKKMSLGTNFGISALELGCSPQKPLSMQMQKLAGNITSVGISGLGTENFGINFGGYLLLKRPAKDSAAKTGGQAATTRNDTLFIDRLSLEEENGQFTFEGKFKLGASGINIKGLRYTTPEPIVMTYSTAEKNFLFEGSGMLTYSKPNATGAAPANDTIAEATNTIFPIEIQKFKLDSKNWSIFFAAKPNLKVDFKVVKFNVDQLVVSVGNTGVSMQEMNDYLVTGTPQKSSIGTGQPDEMFDESTASWAIGVKGGLEFGFRGLNAGINGSFLVGNFNDKVQVKFNDIGLLIVNPAFQLEANVRLATGADSVGFDASGSLKSMGAVLEARFAYMNYKKKGGFRLGAYAKVASGTTQFLVTGPVGWFGIAGGFELNTATNIYSVGFGGEFSAAGTAKASAYLDAYIHVLFDINNCGPFPVVEGTGKLFITNKQWAQVGVKLDFCRTLGLFTVNANIPILEGIGEVRADGVVYAMTEQLKSGARSGCLFMGINADLNILNDLIKGNAVAAIGINYNNLHPHSPQAVKEMWSGIPEEVKDDNGTRLNGIYLDGYLGANLKGDLSASIGDIKVASLKYDFVKQGAATLSYKYSTKEFKARAKVERRASIGASILAFQLNAEAYQEGMLEGAYNNIDKWSLYGKAAMGFKLYNDEGVGCNSHEISFKGTKFTIPYPCGAYWWGIRMCKKEITIPTPDYSFKLCRDLAVTFDYKQATGKPTFSISLN